MKSVSELKSAFSVYYREMQRCEEAGLYWALLHLVLVLPDICAALEHDPSAPVGVGDRYVEWCRANFTTNVRLAPADRFQIRNAVLHEGSTRPDNTKTKNPSKHSRFSSISFVEPGAAPVTIHQNINQRGDNLTLDIKVLAAETRDAMETWFNSLAADPMRNKRVETNLPRLARVQQKTSEVAVPQPDGTFTVVIHRHITTSSS